MKLSKLTAFIFSMMFLTNTSVFACTDSPCGKGYVAVGTDCNTDGCCDSWTCKEE